MRSPSEGTFLRRWRNVRPIPIELSLRAGTKMGTPYREAVLRMDASSLIRFPKVFKEIVKHVSTGGDDHINQLHLDHIADHPAHPARDHGPGQPHEDNAGWIIEHLSKNVKTLKNISALKGGMLEGLDKIEKAFRPFE